MWELDDDDMFNGSVDRIEFDSGKIPCTLKGRLSIATEYLEGSEGKGGYVGVFIVKTFHEDIRRGCFYGEQ